MTTFIFQKSPDYAPAPDCVFEKGTILNKVSVAFLKMISHGYDYSVLNSRYLKVYFFWNHLRMEKFK